MIMRGLLIALLLLLGYAFGADDQCNMTDPAPCTSHGVCYNTSGINKCDCHIGFTGRRCEKTFIEQIFESAKLDFSVESNVMVSFCQLLGNDSLSVALSKVLQCTITPSAKLSFSLPLVTTTTMETPPTNTSEDIPVKPSKTNERVPITSPTTTTTTTTTPATTTTTTTITTTTTTPNTTTTTTTVTTITTTSPTHDEMVEICRKIVKEPGEKNKKRICVS